MTRREAKDARRRRRTQRMRVTAARVNVLADGRSVLIPAKVRGPKRSKVARAAGRAGAERIGGQHMTARLLVPRMHPPRAPRLHRACGRVHEPGDCGLVATSYDTFADRSIVAMLEERRRDG